MEKSIYLYHPPSIWESHVYEWKFLISTITSWEWDSFDVKRIFALVKFRMEKHKQEDFWKLLWKVHENFHEKLIISKYYDTIWVEFWWKIKENC